MSSTSERGFMTINESRSAAAAAPAAAPTGTERRSIEGVELRLAPRGDNATTISGLIPYDRRSREIAGFVEVVKRGAFRSALAGGNVLALAHHQSSQVLGRTRSGTLRLHDAPDGLHFEIDPPQTRSAEELVASIRRGDIDSASFGFKVKSPGGQRFREESGVIVRELLDVELIELGPTSFPAYADATVAVRDLEAWRRRQGEADASAAAAARFRFRMGFSSCSFGAGADAASAGVQ